MTQTVKVECASGSKVFSFRHGHMSQTEWKLNALVVERFSAFDADTFVCHTLRESQIRVWLKGFWHSTPIERNKQEKLIKKWWT